MDSNMDSTSSSSSSLGLLATAAVSPPVAASPVAVSQVPSSPMKKLPNSVIAFKLFGFLLDTPACCDEAIEYLQQATRLRGTCKLWREMVSPELLRTGLGKLPTISPLQSIFVNANLFHQHCGQLLSDHQFFVDKVFPHQEMLYKRNVTKTLGVAHAKLEEFPWKPFKGRRQRGLGMTPTEVTLRIAMTMFTADEFKDRQQLRKDRVAAKDATAAANQQLVQAVLDEKAHPAVKQELREYFEENKLYLCKTKALAAATEDTKRLAQTVLDSFQHLKNRDIELAQYRLHTQVRKAGFIMKDSYTFYQFEPMEQKFHFPHWQAMVGVRQKIPKYWEATKETVEKSAHMRGYRRLAQDLMQLCKRVESAIKSIPANVEHRVFIKNSIRHSTVHASNAYLTRFRATYNKIVQNQLEEAAAKEAKGNEAKGKEANGNEKVHAPKPRTKTEGKVDGGADGKADGKEEAHAFASTAKPKGNPKGNTEAGGAATSKKRKKSPSQSQGKTKAQRK